LEKKNSRIVYVQNDLNDAIALLIVVYITPTVIVKLVPGLINMLARFHGLDTSYTHQLVPKLSSAEVIIMIRM